MATKSTTPRKERTPVTLRMSPALADEVRALADREDASQSTVLRRLVRAGLELERRDAKAGA